MTSSRVLENQCNHFEGNLLKLLLRVFHVLVRRSELHCREWKFTALLSFLLLGLVIISSASSWLFDGRHGFGAAPQCVFISVSISTCWKRKVYCKNNLWGYKCNPWVIQPVMNAITKISKENPLPWKSSLAEENSGKIYKLNVSCGVLQIIVLQPSYVVVLPVPFMIRKIYSMRHYMECYKNGTAGS